jgi:tRNA pseudouridine55 synthase
MDREELLEDFQAGKVLLMHKPLGWTSFDLIRKMRNMLRKNLGVKKIKVGHAGTLDPLASGLMIVCTGKATKRIESLQNLEKEYVTSIKLGEKTPSYDLETEVDQVRDTRHLNVDIISEALIKNQGAIDQIPPMFSAKWHNGKRAYEYARKGDDIQLQAKAVVISNIELLECNLPYIQVRVNCSKGTYIRAIARDIGDYLDCGAHLTELERTAIGNYKLKDALTIKELENYLSLP